MDKITVGVLTVSDRCYNSKAMDESGPKLVRMIDSGVVKNGSVVKIGLVPDCKEDIQKKLTEWSEAGVQVILTTGGTGISERDVTPEATTALCRKTVPGISWLMLKRSLEITPMASLTRAVSGVLENTLIINLPGSKKASQECLEAVAGVIPHAVDLLTGKKEEVERVHGCLQGKKSSVRADDVVGRKRESPYPLISVKEAQDIIMERIYILRSEKMVWYENAHDHVLAQDVVAQDDLPPFDASLLDGYAVLSSDATQERNVIGGSVAGSSPPRSELLPDHCVRVSTGAAIPPGADAVVQVEKTSLFLTKKDEKEESRISLHQLPAKGQGVRWRGSDFKRGHLLLSSGTYLDPGAVGLIAAAGITSVRVYEKPVVAVISTGDELANPGDDLTPGKVRDSNRVTLLSLLKGENLPGVDLGIVADEPEALRNVLERGFEEADVVVTTGSMSMGERDYLKEVLVADFDAEICFGRVLMKPGKPTAFAILAFKGKPKLWFGLPGNPASALVTSHLFLLPALRRISGCEKVFPLAVKAELNGERPPIEDRPEYARGILTYDIMRNSWTAKLVGSQRSSRIGSCVEANCLLVLPNTPNQLPTPVTNSAFKDAPASGFGFEGANCLSVQKPEKNVFYPKPVLSVQALLIGKTPRV